MEKELTDVEAEGSADRVIENSGVSLMDRDRTRDEPVFEPARRSSNVTEKKISSEQFVEAALKKRTFYELINSQEGFLTLQGYFTNAVMLMDRVTGAINNPAVGGNAATDFLDLNNGILTESS